MTAQERLRQAWPADWRVGANPKTSTYLMIGESCLSVAWRKRDALVTCKDTRRRFERSALLPDPTSHEGALRCIPERWAWGALDEVIAGRPLPPVPPWAREALTRAQVQRLEGYAKREADAVAMRAEHERLSRLVVGS